MSIDYVVMPKRRQLVSYQIRNFTANGQVVVKEYKTFRKALKYFCDNWAKVDTLVAVFSQSIDPEDYSKDANVLEVELKCGSSFEETYHLTVDKNWLILCDDPRVLAEAKTWDDTAPCW
jgi:hypothetical protein